MHPTETRATVGAAVTHLHDMQVRLLDEFLGGDRVMTQAMRSEVLEYFGRMVVQLVRDPVVVEFTRGPGVPKEPGTMPEALFSVVPSIVDAVTERWTRVAGDGTFALRVWSDGHWRDPADDAAASGLIGAALVEAVRRDELVEEFSHPGSSEPGVADDPAGDRWRAATQAAELASALAIVAPDIVDAAIGNVLDALDDDELRLQLRSAAHGWVDVSYDQGRGFGGEHLGWFIGTDGWLDRFAHEQVGSSPDVSFMNELRFT